MHIKSEIDNGRILYSNTRIVNYIENQKRKSHQPNEMINEIPFLFIYIPTVVQLKPLAGILTYAQAAYS